MGAHVLVEKPLAPQVREADAMIAAAPGRPAASGVNFQQRFRPVIVSVRELVVSRARSGRTAASRSSSRGRPQRYYGTAGWRGTWAGEGGGVLMNQAPHTLDLLCHLAGCP